MWTEVTELKMSPTAGSYKHMFLFVYKTENLLTN